MAQNSKSLSKFKKLLNSQVITVADDVNDVLFNHELFKLGLKLLYEQLDESNPEGIALGQLMDAYASRSECYLKNLQFSVSRLRDLMAHYQ